jgi:signal transduction histidine kinase/integral membrane sensor domain MASE1
MSILQRRQLATNLAVALVYALLGQATLALGATAGVELRRVIWASSGVAVAVGLLVKFPVWPGVALGGALATFLSGSGPLMIVGTGIANAFEVVLTVAFLRRVNFNAAMERVSDILTLILMGSGVAAAVGAMLSVTSLALSGSVPPGSFLRIFLLWWLTHAMGILVITPFGLTLFRGRPLLAKRNLPEILANFATVALVAWVPFFAEGNSVVARLFFLPFPVLLWAAMRLGMKGATTAALITTFIAMVAAVLHTGPLAVGTPNQALILTWLFSNVVMIATLISTALVTNMQDARGAHQSEEARLRAVLDGTSDGIVVTDAPGTVTHVNRAVGMIWPSNVIAPMLDARFDRSLGALGAVLADPAARELLVPPTGPEGRRGTITFTDGRVWEVHVDHLRQEDSQRGCVWWFRDITERVRAEEERQHLQAQLLHGQKLESLGVMAGGIAHDFNNLLMAIRARAELVRTLGYPSPDVIEDIDGILRTADQAAGLCRQMLIYAGRGAIEVRTIDLSECAREIQDLLRVSVSRRVALQLELSSERLWVSADVTQLRQVTLNLVTNASDAVEATGRGGTVLVRTRRAVLGREWLARAVIGLDVPEGEFHILEVSDDGVGMTEDTVRQIFDPFFSSKGTGRGLGLSSTLGVVRTHKGALAVETRPGGGSRFIVALPAAPAPTGERTPLVVPRPQGELFGHVILVVDDDADVRRVVIRMLQHMGMDVREASDGDEALEQLVEDRERTIEIVLLDLTMPKMSGPATLAAMRAKGIDTPVIIASGYSAEAVQEGEGVMGFVQKPFRIEDLERAIGRVLVKS